MKVSESVSFSGRDIVVVTLDNEDFQPFYRSSGSNSGMKGTWLPFDGLAWFGWFIKNRFSVKDEEGNRLPLHRYGTLEFKAISDKLAGLEIPEGKEYGIIEVNNFLKRLTNGKFPANIE